MTSINVGSVPAEFPQKREGIVDCGAQGPMSQQDAVGSHGHEMYTQEFVQLVGCRDPNAGKHEEVHRLHQISAARPTIRGRRYLNGVTALLASIRI